MAQLKLMKKEWFDWFKGTTLNNITAWTEYYYINPDSQHWISNYQLWDEEWEVGDISDTTGQNTTSSTNIRSKNYIRVIPNERYFIKCPVPPTGIYALFLYDVNHNFLNAVIYNNILNSIYTIPANCHYIRFRCYSSYGTTYKKDICINESNPTFNGKYEPRIIKIEDILGVYNLGDLTWQHQDMGTEHDRFGSSSLQGTIKNSPNGSVKGYIFSNRFVTDTSNNVFNHVNDNAIAVTNNGFILIYNSEYASITGVEFKDLVDGDYIVVMKDSSPY